MHFVVTINNSSLAVQISINYFKIEIMKKLALVLAVAFTMGLATSSVSASTASDNKKAKTEKTTEKKEATKAAKTGCDGGKAGGCASKK
jgi:hypothetical protein